MDDAQRATLEAFKEAVNLTPKALERWLETDDAKRVGQKPEGGGESTGHAMGREIVTLLQKKQGDLTDTDYEKMHKVVSYVHRHLAQRPSGDVENSNWRFSLMNWGHDPLK